MKERPVFMSGPMVCAILDGRKTHTRRTRGLEFINEDPSGWRYDGLNIHGDHLFFDVHAAIVGHDPQDCTLIVKCPYGLIGDHLWVRESWADVTLAFQSHECEEPQVIAFRADDGVYNTRTMHFLEHRGDSGIVVRKWKSSLPRAFSRTTLEIINVRSEQLQDITEKDAESEGVERMKLPQIDEPETYRRGFEYGWNRLNTRRGFDWHKNPWVWVIEFKQVLSR